MSKGDDKFRAFVGPPLGHGSPLVRYSEGGQFQGAGLLLPAQDGQAIPPGAELVRLTERGDGSFDGTTLFRNGPAKVTSPQYRENWDTIFGKKTDVGQA